MAFILVHGLGQDSKSWNDVKKQLDVAVNTPDLFKLLQNKEYKYQDLYDSFCSYLDCFDEKLCICGLSLGGILALDYAKHHPDKVNSLILIGIPHRIPKFLYMIQGLMFHLMPKDNFKDLGVSKKNIIKLTDSMATLNITNGADKVKCKTLLICGSDDNTNKKSLKPLHELIQNSEVAVIEGAGHAVSEDKPLELAKTISSWWQN